MLELTLREWGEEVVEARALERAARRNIEEVARRLLPFVRISPEFSGKVRVSATRKVGEAQLGELFVRVEPHIEVGSMVELLAWLTRGRVHLLETALGATSKRAFSLRIAVAAGFVIATEELLRGEVHRSYARRQERLLVLRGRPDFARLGEGPSAVGVPCRYLELSRDTAPNRALAAGANEALGLLAETRFEGSARQVVRALAQLVTRPMGRAQDFASARDEIGHRHEAYHAVLDLAQMLLLGGGPVSVVGKGGMSGWWIDMPALFERAVIEAVQRWADRKGWRTRTQPRHRGAILDANLELYQEIRPDLEVVDADGQVLALIDAKYKAYLRPGDGREEVARKVDRQDLYQLAFYGSSAPDARLFLVAPAEPGALIPERYRTLHMHDRELQIRGLPLAGLPVRGELALW